MYELNGDIIMFFNLLATTLHFLIVAIFFFEKILNHVNRENILAYICVYIYYMYDKKKILKFIFYKIVIKQKVKKV